MILMEELSVRVGILKKIEQLRLQMIKLAEKKGSLIDPSVIAVSQELDQLLIQLQRIKMKGKGFHNTRFVGCFYFYKKSDA